MADKFSLHGTSLFNGPGQYGDPADMARRQAASSLGDLIGANPNFNPRTARQGLSSNYLSGGLPYDVEGLLSSYALKYGQDKAMQLIDALPHMSQQDLMMVQKDVEGAAREMDGVRDREMQTYERAGAGYNRPPNTR